MMYPWAIFYDTVLTYCKVLSVNLKFIKWYRSEGRSGVQRSNLGQNCLCYRLIHLVDKLQSNNGDIFKGSTQEVELHYELSAASWQVTFIFLESRK